MRNCASSGQHQKMRPTAIVNLPIIYICHEIGVYLVSCLALVGQLPAPRPVFIRKRDCLAFEDSKARQSRFAVNLKPARTLRPCRSRMASRTYPPWHTMPDTSRNVGQIRDDGEVIHYQYHLPVIPWRDFLSCHHHSPNLRINHVFTTCVKTA